MRAVTRSRSKAVNQDLPLVVEGDDEDANNDMDHKRNEDVDNTGEAAAAQYEEDDHNDAPNLEEIAELESMAQVRHEQRRDPTWKPVIDHI
jgi:hypothetical protein